MRPLCPRVPLVLLLAVVLATPLAAVSQVPRKMNYQVMLTDDEDQPLADRPVELVFRIYDAATDGELKWRSPTSS